MKKQCTLVVLFFLVAIPKTEAQDYWSKIEKETSTLGITETYQKINTPEFKLNLKPKKPIIRYEVKADKKSVDNQIKNIQEQ